MAQEVDIVCYQPEFKLQVIDLMQYLWGSDPTRNRSYFEWKYEANPHTKSPLGIVALQEGLVVGFRGYFAVRFEVTGRNDYILVLCPGDTCVHPDYRRQGLSVKMGSVAMREYADQYRIFLNTSCSQNSLPGYLKMGFLPLASKVYVTHSTLFGLVRYVIAGPRGDASPVEASRIRFGSDGDILVSPMPRPEEMSALVARQAQSEGRFGLVQDATFFQWRFGNPRGKYVFYYWLQDGVTTGYVVLSLSLNNRRGHIVDYASTGGRAMQEILSYIIKSKQFDLLSIYGFCLDDGLWQALKGSGFTADSLVRTLERKLYGELPLLVRPVKENYAEADCFVEGLDIRRIENWSFKPIFSDAV
jgi:GNAT superfamily N-acetyltransferase